MADDNPVDVDAMIPTSLADVVRKNRHELVIRLSTKVELDALHGDPAYDGTYKAVLTDWRVIMLDVLVHGRRDPILLGNVDGAPYGMSDVVVLGPHSARTQRGSLYRLAGERAAGEPPLEGLVHLCCLLNAWGWGPYFGVPGWRV